MKIREAYNSHLHNLGHLRCRKCGCVTATGAVTLEAQARLDRPDLCRGCWLRLHGQDPDSFAIGRRKRRAP